MCRHKRDELDWSNPTALQKIGGSKNRFCEVPVTQIPHYLILRGGRKVPCDSQVAVRDSTR